MMSAHDRAAMRAGTGVGLDGTARISSEIAALKRERAGLAEERWGAAFKAGGDGSLAAKFTRGAGLAPGRLAEILERKAAIEQRLALTVLTNTKRNRGALAA